MPTAMAAPHSSKSELRRHLRAVRERCDPSASLRLVERLLSAWRPPDGAIVAGYWPLSGEIDVRPLMQALAQRGCTLALPETPPPGSALTFHRWQDGAALLPGRFGTVHPPPDEVVPDVLLVPLLGFDRGGHRLGYGAGYYDRTLAVLPGAYAIGCGFAAQEVARVPAEVHDRRLDLIATEAAVIEPTGGA